MRRRTAALTVLMALLAVAEGDEAAAATCYAECRREINDILCYTVEVTSGDRTSTTRYYWTR